MVPLTYKHCHFKHVSMLAFAYSMKHHTKPKPKPNSKAQPAVWNTWTALMQGGPVAVGFCHLTLPFGVGLSTNRLRLCIVLWCAKKPCNTYYLLLLLFPHGRTAKLGETSVIQVGYRTDLFSSINSSQSISQYVSVPGPDNIFTFHLCESL